MKSLIFGIVLILLLGAGGFVYRNVMETTGGPEPVACTMEAKLCPDGSGVGRTGPQCEFAPCAFPNVEMPNVGIAFVLPEGYAADENAYGADESLLGAFTKASLSENVPHTIIIRRYPIPDGSTAEEVIVTNTRFQPSDMPASDIEEFDTILINGRTIYVTVIERFEAQVESAYFIPRATDVLRFEIIERDVVDWMEPSLVVADLPEHTALIKLLGTFQSP